MAKQFISPLKKYVLEYPDNWKLEWENQDTIMLFKKSSLFAKESKYTLRLSNLVLDQIPPLVRVTDISSKLKQNNVIFETIKTDHSQILKWKTIFDDSNPGLVQDNSVILVGNNIVVSTFTTVKGEENSTRANEERDIAQKIIYSIKSTDTS